MADIQIITSAHGGELRGISRAGKPYMWNADPSFWGRVAPILFPIVGQVRDKTFRAEGRTFTMGQHGIARDAEFVRTGEHAYRLLQETPAANYPYPFELTVRYEVDADSVLCAWTVRNIGQGNMYFQIGAHPAFLLPDYRPEDAVHGYFECYNADGDRINPLAFTYIDGGLRSPYPSPRPLGERIPITADTFAADALLIEGSQVASCSLLDKAGNKVLTVESPMAEAFGLWASHKPGCPFVCIEPWCGITDHNGFTGDFSQKDLIHSLQPGGVFDFSYRIRLHVI